MKKRSLLVALLSASLVGSGLWVAVPPFPDPRQIVGHPYREVLENLGPPTGGIATKFVAWDRRRGLTDWELEIYSETPKPDLTWVPREAKRCLWVPSVGVTLWCDYAMTARVLLDNYSTRSQAILRRAGMRLPRGSATSIRRSWGPSHHQCGAKRNLQEKIPRFVRVALRSCTRTSPRPPAV